MGFGWCSLHQVMHIKRGCDSTEEFDTNFLQSFGSEHSSKGQASLPVTPDQHSMQFACATFAHVYYAQSAPLEWRVGTPLSRSHPEL